MELAYVEISNSSCVFKIKVRNENDQSDIISAIYALQENMAKQKEFKFRLLLV